MFKTRIITLASIVVFPTILSAQALDTAKIDEVLGRPGRKSGNVYRVGFPRTDLHVKIGDVEVRPGLALGEWAAFSGSDEHAMVMGDLVLLEKEVNPVMLKLRAANFDITAVHNHVLDETPQILYMHYLGHGPVVGSPDAVAQGIKAALGEPISLDQEATEHTPSSEGEAGFMVCSECAELEEEPLLANTTLICGNGADRLMADQDFVR